MLYCIEEDRPTDKTRILQIENTIQKEEEHHQISDFNSARIYLKGMSHLISRNNEESLYVVLVQYFITCPSITRNVPVLIA